jgi:hypothetical protein
MKRQRGFIVFLGAAWLAIAAAVGGVALVDHAMNDKTAGPELARRDAPTAYVGTSLAEAQAQNGLDWAQLSK